MEKVVVQTGAKTYQIADQDGNDLGVFRFIPSDAGILKRYKEAAAFFTGINDKIKDKIIQHGPKIKLQWQISILTSDGTNGNNGKSTYELMERNCRTGNINDPKNPRTKIGLLDKSFRI